MKIVITGGTGMIGSALAESLLSDSHEVSIISRSPKNVSQQFHPISWDETSLAEGLGGTDAVINLAGASLAGDNPLNMRWTSTRKHSIKTSRLNAGKKLVQAISKLDRKPEVFVQASAIGYYGNHGLDPADENSDTGNDFLADVCREWEASTVELEELGIRRLIVRIGLVLNQSGGLLPLLALPSRLFIGGKIGNGQQYLSWVHIQDIVNSLKYLIKDQGHQGVYNLCAPNPETNLSFVRALGRNLHRPTWLPIPAPFLKLVLGEAATLALDGRPVYPTRLLNTGYQFHYKDLDDCLQNLLQ